MKKLLIAVSTLVFPVLCLAGEVKPTFYENTGILELANVEVGDSVLWLQLQLIDAENLTFAVISSSVTDVTPADSASPPSASAIVGTWAPTGIELRFTFREDGTYEMFQGADLDVDACPNGGTETGTYDWTPDTGVFRANIENDGNGRCGTSHPSGALRFIPDGNVMHLYEGGQLALQLNKS